MVLSGAVRDLNEYTLGDWATGTPVVHGFKRVRNIAVDRYFRASKRRDYERAMATLSGSAGQPLVIMISFNTPWALDLSTRLALRNLKAKLVVCDNSRDRAARREIERMCRDRGVSYIALPFNPEWNPCRSHGIALNWVYYNVVLPLRPEIFAFLDHDLLLTHELDPVRALGDQPLFGIRRDSRWGWYLWPGFCMYRLSALSNYIVDFNTDIPRELDTGGRNWLAVYRHLERDRLKFATRGSVRLRVGDGLPAWPVETIDDHLHILGVSFGDRRPALGDKSFFNAIVRHVEQGGTPSDLLASSPGEVTDPGRVGAGAVRPD